MDALFQDNPAIMVALLALFILGAVLVALSVAREVRGWKISVLAHSSVWTRLCAGALGFLLIGGGVFLALHTSGDRTGDGPDDPGVADPSDGPSDGPSDNPPEPTEPPTEEPPPTVEPTVVEADLGTPEEVDFTIPVIDGHNQYCWDLDVEGTAQAERSWFGLCGATGHELYTHQGYGIIRWEQDEAPDPRSCLDQITRHGAAGYAAVAEGSVVCVSTRDNRVAVLTVDGLDGGFRMSGEVWGPLLD